MGVVGVVHTTRLVIEPLHRAIVAGCPGLELNHVLDEGILRRLAALGSITSEIVEWLTAMVSSAQRAGAECAVVSCSSLSPCVAEVAGRVTIPVIKVDEPMMEYAIGRVADIGLVMTNPTTQEPSTRLFNEVAGRLGRRVNLVSRLVPDAFSLLSRGDIKAHDRAVSATVVELLQQVDLVLLAQISIARVKGHLETPLAGRVLSSLDFIAGKIMAVGEAREAGRAE